MENNSLSLNKLIMGMFRRPESQDLGLARKTFVRLENFTDFLEMAQHQVIYGRRGTGKTHALLYLVDKIQESDDLAVYIDMRQISSSGGLYANPEIPISQRGTQMLADILARLHDDLLGVAVSDQSTRYDGLLPLLDALLDSAAQVQVVGDVEQEVALSGSRSAEETTTIGVEVSRTPFRLGTSTTGKRETSESSRSLIRGKTRPHIIFGALGRAWKELAAELAPARVWILLDEWTAIPIELQPILADLLRRALLPLSNVVLKIGAIEGSSMFEERFPDGDYLGIELGADVPVIINLDDQLSASFRELESGGFFLEELLFRHLQGLNDGQSLPFQDAAMMRRQIFHEPEAFTEFVRASEGIPRDAINILAIAALKAGKGSIRLRNVRGAATDYYLSHKSARIKADAEARALLKDLLDEILGRRRARTFLLSRDVDARDPRVRELYEARLIHIIRRGLAAIDEPGTLYDAFAIDYGCYTTALTEEYVKLLRDPWKEIPSTDTKVNQGLVHAQVFQLKLQKQ